MSYAAAFRSIFDSILGAVAHSQKPRLKKVGKFWRCMTPDGRLGYGVNPGMAYGAWKASGPTTSTTGQAA